MSEDISNENNDMAVVIAVEEITPEQLEEIARIEAEARVEKEAAFQDLADSIQSKLRERSANRQAKEIQWITAEELCLGSLAEIGLGYRLNENYPFNKETKDSSYKVNIVDKKCEVAEAQIVSRQFGAGDKNWDLPPLPGALDGVTPEDVAFRAERLEEVIYKQLTNSKYGHQARLALRDLIRKGAGVLKGPINRLRNRKTYKISPDGMAVPVFEQVREPSVVCVDPWFFYPDDSVANVEECTDSIEVHPMSKAELLKLAKRRDFFSDEILSAIEGEPLGMNKEVLNNLYTSFSSNNELWRDKYCVCEYYGPISKDKLGKMSVDIPLETPEDTMYAEVWSVGKYIIRIELSNIEGTDTIPYAVDVWKEDPGNIFGIPLPLLMKDNQEVINIAWRALLDNASIIAMPQAAIDKTAIDPQNGKWDIEPGKIWLNKTFGTNIQQAIQFFYPPSNIDQLMAVMNLAQGHAEEEPGVPLLAQGIQSPRAQDAGATGQAIMEEYSTTVLDLRAESWDDRVTERVISWFVDWNMQYNPDPTIKVPVEIDVKSSTQLRGQQVQAKNLEKLLVQSAQDPVAGMVINRQNAYKAYLSTINIPYRNIVRSDEEIAAEQEKQAQNQQPDPKVLQIQLDSQRLELEKARLQFEIQSKMKMEELDSMERMENAKTRRMEAEAQVLGKQLEFQKAMAELAARSETDRAKIMADLDKANTDQQVKLFLAGQDHQNKTREIAIKEAEATQAIKTGEGW